MYLTQKNQIKGLSKAEYTALSVLCRLSKNLYNVGLYSLRQFFFAETKYLRYESNYHACKGNENYRLLNTDIANGATNIGRKSKHEGFSRVSSGLLASPLRISIS